MQYTSDPQYPPGDEESRERECLSRREANVALKCAATRSRADYRGQKILHLGALRKIKTSKELRLVYYGMEYLF